MTLLVYDLEAGPEGGALTAGNSGASQITVNTGSALYRVAMAGHGTFGAQFNYVASDAQCLGRWSANASSLTMSFGGWLTSPSTTPAADLRLATLRFATGVAGVIGWTTTNAISIFDTTGANHINVYTSPAFSTLYWVSFRCVVATSTTGTFTCNVYDQYGNLLGTASSTTYNLGTAAITAGDFGVVNSVATSLTVGWDYLSFNDGSTAEILPPGWINPTPQAFIPPRGYMSPMQLARRVTLGDQTLVSGGVAATATGSLSFDATASAQAAATASGSLSFDATATGQAAATAAGSLTFGGAVTAQAAATASGSLTLGGAANWTAPSSSGSLTFGGTAASGVTAAGSLTFGGSATAQAPATTAGSLTFGGSATAQAPVTAAGLVTFGGSATAQAPVTASGNITFGGTATATGRATAAGSIVFGGSATASLAGTAAGSLTFNGSTTARAPVTAAGSISLSATATARALAIAAGSITLQGLAAASASPNAAGSLELAATAFTGPPPVPPITVTGLVGAPITAAGDTASTLNLVSATGATGPPITVR